MKTKISDFFAKKGVVISLKTYFIDAMGSMALGLFASLLIGTIFKTIGQQFNLPWLLEVAGYATTASGAAIGFAVAHSLKAPPLVLFSSATVGICANAIGGPLGVFLSVIISTELGKLVSKETKVDILVTPTVSIITGCAFAFYVGKWISAIMTSFGQLINNATELEPLLMGILVSVILGIVLTLPISSAALCIMLGLSGLAGGAAVAGCCAQMVGFAVASIKENGVAGVVAQGLGTSMLQIPNIIRRPAIWLAPTITAAICGPLATMLFKLEVTPEFSVAAGMGTCGLVGPIGVFSSMGSSSLAGIIVVCFIAPALLSYYLDMLFRKIGWVKDGDQKIEL